ncbi:MAG: hypothetical protein M3Y21_09460 [Candidatus Eremiobacteraeota bacterium]|nr:hypothetical protein [Candidatus Eremiobacteraeota bacterium]
MSDLQEIRYTNQENDKYGKLTLIDKGMMHRPRSPQKSVVLMVEQVGIVPTGS